MSQPAAPRDLQQEGPELETLLRHLMACPPLFLALPELTRSGHRPSKAPRVVVHALVHDLLTDVGAQEPQSVSSIFFASATRDIAPVRLVSVACWLLSHDAFRKHPDVANITKTLLISLREGRRGRLVAAKLFVHDPDRREELVRVALAAFGWRPRGESTSVALDRLTTLDTVEQARILAATKAAHERAQKVREAMKKKAAEQAAAKVSRE